MTLGRTPRQPDVFRSTVDFCAGLVSENSIYAVLHRECHRLFGDEMFADLFEDVGRRSVPPMIVAVTMVLQRFEGLSDREATDRFCFDLRWKYACGGLDFDHPGFVHTVLVDMRARLAASQAPNRIFDVVLEVAGQAGLVGRKRAVDSTPVYDAVATMDTITLIRSAIRGVLKAADSELEAALRAALGSGDEYASNAKPQIDWDDAEQRDALIDSRAKDAMAVLALVEGRRLDPVLAQASRLLATVIGQDLERDGEGVFTIARKVAKDRVISTVDVAARHGHKTQHRSFDGYKGHVAADPDTEIITATTITPGSSGDAEAVPELLADDLAADEPDPAHDHDDQDESLAVYGDSAYGTGPVLARLEEAEADIKVKTQPANAPAGRFTKDDFTIDLEEKTVTCPAGQTTSTLRPNGDKGQTATFGQICADCPLRDRCTTAKTGRTITISPHEQQLAAARARQRDPGWQADYKATRPKIERKIGHLMRRRHGGRRARMRGPTKIAADFSLLAAAVNLARLAVLGLTPTSQGQWTVATT